MKHFIPIEVETSHIRQAYHDNQLTVTLQVTILVGEDTENRVETFFEAVFDRHSTGTSWTSVDSRFLSGRVRGFYGPVLANIIAATIMSELREKLAFAKWAMG